MVVTIGFISTLSNVLQDGVKLTTRVMSFVLFKCFASYLRCQTGEIKMERRFNLWGGGGGGGKGNI